MVFKEMQTLVDFPKFRLDRVVILFPRAFSRFSVPGKRAMHAEWERHPSQGPQVKDGGEIFLKA